MKKLTETDRKVFMSDKEKALKKRLIALLKDDGKGHHHAKYAARLADFDINIVPLKRDPNFTAAISFEDGVIYIGEGFLNDPSTFGQLNVLLRHELAHNLLMHEIRMMHKIGSNPYSHIKYSQTIHELLNIIMDFEISNKKYSAEDKIAVRNMWLNGHLIGGLVTEDHRKNWENMSVEEMYEALKKEIAIIQTELLADRSWRIDSKDMVNNRVLGARIYSDISSPTSIRMPIEDFIKSSTYKKFPKEIQGIIQDLYNNIVLDDKTAYSKTDIDKYQKQLADSAVTEEVDLISPDGVVITTIYTPEEKQIAIDVLKSINMYSNKYTEWYTKVMDVLNNDKYSNADLTAILQGIKK